MARPIPRRTFLRTTLGAMTTTLVTPLVSSCGRDESQETDGTGTGTSPARGWHMPAEDRPHDATWMCFPSSADVWGRDLADIQSAIADIALAIAEFEPVRMLARPDARSQALDLVGSDVELIDGPVDDLWARDTLPLFLVDPNTPGALSAARVRFNGWGDKQIHAGDSQLAGHVADLLGIELIDTGVTGEGGGVETDGYGTLIAARSSWINPNRNPGRSEDDIATALVAGLGASRMLWVDGIAGEDITDGHIDTLARFVDATTIIHEYPLTRTPLVR